MPKVCPVMSVTFPNFRQEGLKKVQCLGEECEWWVYVEVTHKKTGVAKDYSGCALKVLTKGVMISIADVKTL